MKMHKMVLAAGLFVVSGSALTASAAFVIDDFSQTAGGYPLVRTTVSPAGVYAGVDEPGLAVPGGIRGVGINGVSFDVPDVDNSTALVSLLGGGFVDYNSTTGARSNLGIIYGAYLFAPPPALNLNYSSVTAFQLDFLGYDAPGLTAMAVGVLLTGSNGSGQATAALTVAGPQSVLISTAGIDPAVLADVDGMFFYFLAPKSADLRLGAISAVVPEPSMMALPIAAAACMLRRRRK